MAHGFAYKRMNDWRITNVRCTVISQSMSGPLTCFESYDHFKLPSELFPVARL